MSSYEKGVSYVSPLVKLSLVAGDTVSNNAVIGKKGHGGGFFVYEQSSSPLAPVMLFRLKYVTIFSNKALGTVLGNETSGIFYMQKRLSPRASFSISNCRISNNRGIGITLSGTPDPLGGGALIDNRNNRIIRIEQNQMRKNNIAIYLDKTLPTDIVGNNFAVNNKIDIYCNDILEKVRIRKNSFSTKKSSAGIFIQKSSDPIIIVKNNFSGYADRIKHLAVRVLRVIVGPLGGKYFINAKNNYWGDPKGPNDPAAFGIDGDYNTSPKGCYVSDWVDYKPPSESINR